VENKNADTPERIESDSSVNNTLILTFPHRIVVSKKFESWRMLSTNSAALLSLLLATSSCKRLRLKNAKFKPENIADCDMQKAMPIQLSNSTGIASINEDIKTIL
jgi:hypothetical protein